MFYPHSNHSCQLTIRKTVRKREKERRESRNPANHNIIWLVYPIFSILSGKYANHFSVHWLERNSFISNIIQDIFKQTADKSNRALGMCLARPP